MYFCGAVDADNIWQLAWHVNDVQHVFIMFEIYIPCINVNK